MEQLYNKYYRWRRQEIINNLTNNKPARINKLQNLLAEIELDCGKLKLLIREIKNLRRQIRRERILQSSLRNIKG